MNRRAPGTGKQAFALAAACFLAAVPVILRLALTHQPAEEWDRKGETHGTQTKCAGTENSAQTGNALETETITVHIPGDGEKTTLLWVSDLHLMDPEDRGVRKEKKQEVEDRRTLMETPDKIPSAEFWKSMAPALDSMGADGIILGGDMIDYASGSNLELFKENLASWKTPWMYLRADHDYGRWYTDLSLKKMRALQRQVCPQNSVWLWRFDDFNLVGLDNTTSPLSDEALNEFEKIYASGKPMVLCMHVPIDQQEPDAGTCRDGSRSTLKDLSVRDWGRNLTWGEGAFYDSSKNSNMRRLIGLVYEKGSPVKAVLAGHLHDSWDGMAGKTAAEHVFSPAFSGTAGVVNIVADKND